MRIIGRPSHHIGLSPRRLALALVAPLLSLACSGSGDQQEPPNIVLVLVDTLRADHTSLYGYERETTPNLSRIAEQGTVMRRHFANAPWTKPSVATLLTGVHPTAHGSRVGQFVAKVEGPNNQPRIDVLSNRHVTFVEALREIGYRTKAHVSNYNMLAKWGYDQGYDDYELVERAHNKIVIDSDRAAINFALSSLEEADRPTFVWSHLMSVHQYVAPEEHQIFEPDGETTIDPGVRSARKGSRFGTVENMVANYDASIRYVDELIGELWDAIQADHPNTVLIVTSDHGEEFLDHGGLEHCWTLYNELLKVPLVMAGPGVPKDHEVMGITDSLDVYPTVLATATIDPEKYPRPGQVLAVDGAATEGKSETFAEQHHRGPFIRFALNRDGSKFIESYRKRPKQQGDARRGPLVLQELFRESWEIERENMIDSASNEEIESLASGLEDYRRASKAWFAKEIGTAEYGTASEADLEALRAIGYAGTEDELEDDDDEE